VGVLNQNQLQLFMTGSELKSTINRSSDLRPGENMSSMWGRKLERAKEPGPYKHGSGVYDTLMSEGYDASKPRLSGMGDGVVGPIRLQQSGFGDNRQTRVSDAHHRIAAADDIERQTGQPVWMPVEYDSHDHMLSERKKPKKADSPT
jgi:hypothetical protein